MSVKSETPFKKNVKNIKFIFLKFLKIRINLITKFNLVRLKTNQYY
jgi:hypothetical protein